MIYIFIWIVFGVIGYKMAETRGRDPIWGAIGGGLFGVFAFIYYLIVGDSPKKKEKELEVLIQKNIEKRQ